MTARGPGCQAPQADAARALSSLSPLLWLLAIALHATSNTAPGCGVRDEIATGALQGSQRQQRRHSKLSAEMAPRSHSNSLLPSESQSCNRVIIRISINRGTVGLQTASFLLPSLGQGISAFCPLLVLNPVFQDPHSDSLTFMRTSDTLPKVCLLSLLWPMFCPAQISLRSLCSSGHIPVFEKLAGLSLYILKATSSVYQNS